MSGTIGTSRITTVMADPKLRASIKAGTARQLFDAYVGTDPTDVKILDCVFTKYRPGHNDENDGLSFEEWFVSRISFQDSYATARGPTVTDDIETATNLELSLNAAEWDIWKHRVKRQLNELVNLRASSMNLLNRIQYLTQDRKDAADTFIGELVPSLQSIITYEVILPPESNYAQVDALTGLVTNIPEIGDLLGITADLITVASSILESGPPPQRQLDVLGDGARRSLEDHMSTAIGAYDIAYKDAIASLGDFRDTAVRDLDIMHELADIDDRVGKVSDNGERLPGVLQTAGENQIKKDIIARFLPAVTYIEGCYIGTNYPISRPARFDQTDSVIAYSSFELLGWLEVVPFPNAKPAPFVCPVYPNMVWRLRLGDPNFSDRSVAIGAAATDRLVNLLKAVCSTRELFNMVGLQGELPARVQATHDASAYHKWVAKPGIVGPPSRNPAHRHWVGDQYRHFFQPALLKMGDPDKVILVRAPFLKSFSHESRPSFITVKGTTYYVERRSESIPSISWRAALPSPADGDQWFFSTW